MLLVHVVHSEGYKKSKKKKAQVYTQDHWPTQPKFILISLEHEVTKSITTPPLKGMLVHYKVTPFPECHQASLTIRWYSSWVERQCERKVFAQEQHVNPARVGISNTAILYHLLLNDLFMKFLEVPHHR